MDRCGRPPRRPIVPDLRDQLIEGDDLISADEALIRSWPCMPGMKRSLSVPPLLSMTCGIGKRPASPRSTAVS